MEQKSLSLKEEYRSNIESAKRIAYDALDHGRATLETLDQQEEHIQSVEDTLEANDHVIQKSARALKGMTWGGYISNKCSDLKTAVVGEPATNSAINSRGVNSANTQATSAKPLSASSIGELLDGSGSAVRGGEEDDLGEISAAVEALHMMGVALGESLDSHKDTLERIEHKTQVVTDHTLAVTLRTAQMLRKTHRPIQSFVGTFQLLDVASGRYLSVSAADNVSIAFTERGGMASVFHVFVKQGHLFGLLSEKNQKYLGCTFLGAVQVSGEYFGAQEECYLDLGPLAPGAAEDRRQGASTSASALALQPTGLLFVSRHWGNGGWLKLGSSRPADEAEWVAGETTSSITDKAGAVQLQVVRCKVSDAAEPHAVGRS